MRITTLRILFSVALIAGVQANAASIENICTPGESHSFVEICAREEQTAKTRVDNMEVDDRIFVYCARIAGDSYSAIETCMLREQRAKARSGYPDI